MEVVLLPQMNLMDTNPILILQPPDLMDTTTIITLQPPDIASPRLQTSAFSPQASPHTQTSYITNYKLKTSDSRPPDSRFRFQIPDYKLLLSLGHLN